MLVPAESAHAIQAGVAGVDEVKKVRNGENNDKDRIN